MDPRTSYTLLDELLRARLSEETMDAMEDLVRDPAVKPIFSRNEAIARTMRRLASEALNKTR